MILSEAANLAFWVSVLLVCGVFFFLMISE